jgi:hypothetical protein
MLIHVLVSIGHTIGHLVCNGGTSYISKVPALFKVKVNHFHCVNCLLDIYCLCALACMLCSRLTSTLGAGVVSTLKGIWMDVG